MCPRPPDPMRPLHSPWRRRAARKKVRGCIYARFSTKFQQSIPDQVFACKQWAKKNGITVLDCHIFTDEAVTAKKRRRVGLQAMLDALARNEVDVVITFATNRLHRKIHLALQFVEETIIEKRRRCVFVAQNIDTGDTKFWKALVYVFAMLDEMGVQMSTAHIRQAHIGLLLRGRIHGTIPFGYTGVEVPGELTRRNRPSRRPEIDSDAARWVVQAFEWFVRGSRKVGYKTIAKRLRDANVPPPPKVKRWTSKAVKYLLMNRRYIGDWSYGWKETVWQSQADYARQFPKETPTHENLDESLRIVPDTLFRAAQEKIASMGGCGGRPSHKGGPALPDVAAEVLWCDAHERYVSVRGHGGSQLACPACKAEQEAEQPLYSLMNRDLARRLLFTTLAVEIKRDEAIVAEVLQAAQRQVAAAGLPDEQRLQSLRRELGALNQQSGFILQNPGETETDKAENVKELTRVRRRRTAVESEIADCLASASVPTAVPTEADVREILQRLAELLVKAAEGDDPADHADALGVVAELTGGKVHLSQQGERRHRGGWLRGTFRLRLLDAALVDAGFAKDEGEGREVVIDFRDPPASEAIADEAKALWDDGLLVKQIAAELSGRHGRAIGRNLVASALGYWHESRGLGPCPDGRSRRSTLSARYSASPP